MGPQHFYKDKLPTAGCVFQIECKVTESGGNPIDKSIEYIIERLDGRRVVEPDPVVVGQITTLVPSVEAGQEVVLATMELDLEEWRYPYCVETGSFVFLCT